MSQWPSNMGDNPQWGTSMGFGPSPGPTYQSFAKTETSSADDYESSDDSRNWSDTYNRPTNQYRPERSLSASSSNTTGSFDYQDAIQQQHTQSSHSMQQYAIPYGPSQFSVQSDANISQSHMNTMVRGFGTNGSRTGIDTSVPRAGPEDDEVTPVHRTQLANMGPPLATPSRGRDVSSHFSQWPIASLQPPSQRPQVPRLLTGARMPKPADAGQPSAKPLFSAQVDLSGWLEEPVVPSPLYRMGPSLSALGTPGASFIPPTPVAHGNSAANQTLNAVLSQHQQQTTGSSSAPASDTVMSSSSDIQESSQVAARNWWAATKQARNGVDTQTVAQVCAGHFTLYPALMVLPDASSPVPPLFHRPWLAHIRPQTPASLAQVRIALAAYQVRLPSCEEMVWSMIIEQARSIVASIDSVASSNDMEVFASASSLWFLIILLLMSSDPNTGTTVGDGIVDSSLIGLSQLARILQQRVQAREQVLSQQESGGSTQKGPNNSTVLSFFDWGFNETMRRTLYACYALFVLQRFRETSPELQSQLAGIELVLDIRLPATASEFEAGNELEWRAAQHVRISDEQGDSGKNLSIRDLLESRDLDSPDSNGTSPVEKRSQILAYFDRHDDFTNVCLTVAFALDSRIS